MEVLGNPGTPTVGTPGRERLDHESQGHGIDPALDPRRHRRVLLHDLHGGVGFFDSSDRGADQLLADLLAAEGFEVSRSEPTAGMEGDVSPTTDTTEQFDLILYIARLATRSNQTTVRIEWAQPMGANAPLFASSVPTVFVSVENPYHLLDVPRVPVYINTYNASDVTIRALVDNSWVAHPSPG